MLVPETMVIAFSQRLKASSNCLLHPWHLEHLKFTAVAASALDHAQGLVQGAVHVPGHVLDRVKNVESANHLEVASSPVRRNAKRKKLLIASWNERKLKCLTVLFRVIFFLAWRVSNLIRLQAGGNSCGEVPRRLQRRPRIRGQLTYCTSTRMASGAKIMHIYIFAESIKEAFK